MRKNPLRGLPGFMYTKQNLADMRKAMMAAALFMKSYGRAPVFIPESASAPCVRAERPAESEPKWLSSGAAETEYGITVGILRGAASRGEIRMTKEGRYNLYHRGDIERFIQ